MLSSGQGVKNLKIVEYNIFNAFNGLVFIGTGAPGMGRSNQSRSRAHPVVKFARSCRGTVQVGKAVQIEQRFPDTSLEQPDPATPHIEMPPVHCAASWDCGSPNSGNSLENSSAESRLRTGATSSANSFMLFRASSGRMLPK